MLLNIPFYSNAFKDCGPVSLQMVLEFFDEKYDLERIRQLVDPETGGGTWTIGIAKAAAQLGFKVEFYTKHLGINPKSYKLDFYKKETSGIKESKERLQRITKECLKLGVKLNETRLSLDEILSKINNDCVPIILIDWNMFIDNKGYQGHILPITGYDNKYIYVHQPGPMNPRTNFPIEKGLFNKARKAKGTDEDVVFIHKKV